MPSWSSDGLVAGYDSSDNALKIGVYHLAVPGTVDINGVTRMQYALPNAVADDPDYPNRLGLTIPMTFTSADFIDNPGTDTPGSNKRGLMPGAFLARDYDFPSGTVPTPQQILKVGYKKLGWWLADVMSHTPGTHTYHFKGWTPTAFEPETKYWLLVLPCVYDVNFADVPLRPMKDIDVNALGRAISLWSNRKPAKPVITSPVNNSVMARNTVFNLKFTNNDPDAIGAGDRYDRDLAGVQIAVSSLPTEDDPTPTKYLLNMKTTESGPFVGTSVYMNQKDVLAGDPRIAMLNNSGLPIRIGGQDAYPRNIGEAALPAGDWLIYVRTADYGNPYPTLPNTAKGKYKGFTSFNQVPVVNASDWSDPVKVSVFEQVPPPQALYPKGEIAIPETSTTRLAYRYRDTYDPPFPQAQRSIQMRAVGEENWHTIEDGQHTTSTTLDLPPGYTIDAPPDPIPAPLELMPNPGFEDPGLGGWVEPDLYPAAYRATGSGNEVHSGTHALAITDSSWGGVGVQFAAHDIDEDYNSIRFTGWVRVNPDLAGITIIAGWGIEDPAIPGNYLFAGTQELNSFNIFYLGRTNGTASSPWSGVKWLKIDTGPMPRPKNNNWDTSGFMVQVFDAAVSGVTPDERMRLDDVSLVASYEPHPDGPLTLDATTEYEWRAMAVDSGVYPAEIGRSRWGDPARFWIVPGAGSGETKPLPASTIDGATLGCGTHEVHIYRRGGKERVGVLSEVSHVDWKRVRDDISDAKIEVSGWSPDCGVLLSQLQTWAYEVVIFRDNGYTKDRVWEGPITLLTYETDKVTIQAKDVMGYAYRRIIRQKMDDSSKSSPTRGRTVVARATEIMQNAFAPDDPNILAYLTPLPSGSDATQYRSTPAYSRTAFEEIDDMAANAGLDYTAMGRSVLLWGTKNRIGTLPEFRDKDLGATPIVSEYGMSMANVYSVSDGNGIHGEATRLDVSGNDPIYGRVEMLSSTWASDSDVDTGSYTQEGIATITESFRKYAERSIADRYPPPVVVRIPDNTTLSPDAVVSVQQLVPGVVVPLRSTGTLRTVVDNQKLDSVSVVEDGGKETITITLSPFTRDDAGAVGGEGTDL